jgi:hypothetical protein
LLPGYGNRSDAVVDESVAILADIIASSPRGGQA